MWGAVKVLDDCLILKCRHTLQQTQSISAVSSPQALVLAPLPPMLTRQPLQQPDQWTAQVFLGGYEIRNSPVNITAPNLALSADLSYALNAKGEQLQPCSDRTACAIFFEVGHPLSDPSSLHTELSLLQFHQHGTIHIFCRTTVLSSGEPMQILFWWNLPFSICSIVNRLPDSQAPHLITQSSC